MEDLFGLIMVIIAVAASIANKSKKKQAAKASTVTFKAVPMAAAPPVAAPVKTEQLRMPLEPEPKAEPLPAVRQVVQPQVQVTAKAPEKVMGSLRADTDEGEDPCHEEQFEAMDTVPAMAPVSAERPGIELDWSGDNMVKAFMMQEVLTRPCQRHRRA